MIVGHPRLWCARPSSGSNDPGNDPAMNLPLCLSLSLSLSPPTPHSPPHQQDIEKHITELGGIFDRLNTILTVHQDLTARIDDNVDNAARDLEAGEAQIQKYHNYIASNKGLALKLFFVLMAFIAFFIIFLA